MNKDIFIIILLLLAQTSIYTQNNKRYYNVEEQEIVNIKAEYANKDSLRLNNSDSTSISLYLDIANDTVFTDDGIYFFNVSGSPFCYFEGNKSFIYSDDIYPFRLRRSIDFEDNRGYTLNWRIKDGKLYIEQIYPEHWKNDSKEDVSQKEATRKLEGFLGRKFNRKGLLEADWVTGTFYLVTIRPSYENFYNIAETQKVYSIQLEKGRLIKMTHQEGIEKDLRKNMNLVIKE
jgi:hypothetical protein